VVSGKTGKEIGHALARSPDTIAAQMRSARRKFGVTSRTALAVRAAETGISADPPGNELGSAGPSARTSTAARLRVSCWRSGDEAELPGRSRRRTGDSTGK